MNLPMMTLFLGIFLVSPQRGEVEIKAQKVSDSIYMLTGRGGNMGLSVGEDGAFLIDDQFAPLTEKIRAAVAKITAEPVRFLVNTHWHGDHTGGNENFGKAGTILVAHENVRRRMSKGQFNEVFKRKIEPSPEGALPKITFTDAMSFHWNGEEIRVFHVKNAHTDGDAIIHFTKSNVLHMGDTFFHGSYPYIDTGSKGSLDGVISTANLILDMTGPQTRIIPGHGPLASRKDLETYRDMLVEVRKRVLALIQEGKSADEVVAARPTKDFDEAWGKGFMKPDLWIRIVYSSLAARTQD